MASDVEDDVLYENLNKKNSYDEVTLNFGRPVIQPNEDDIFSSISFSSPIEDLKPKTPPIPAPRLSKQKSIIRQILQEDAENIENKEPEVKFCLHKIFSIKVNFVYITLSFGVQFNVITY